MSRDGWRTFLIGTSAIMGAALVALVFARPWLERDGAVLREGEWIFLMSAGLILILAAAAVRAATRMVRPGLRPHYEGCVATRRELKHIHAIATSVFGPDVSPLAKMRTWYRRNPTLFRVVHRVKGEGLRRSKEIVGYYCMIPLTKGGVERLRRGEVTGAGFSLKDIAAPGKRPAAVYVGGIVAIGPIACGNAQYLWAQELAEEWPALTGLAYARPVSKEGLALARRYGFSAVDQARDDELDALFVRKLAPEGAPYVLSNTLAPMRRIRRQHGKSGEP